MRSAVLRRSALSALILRALLVTALLGLTACGSEGTAPSGTGAGSTADEVTVRLVTHDSFAASEALLEDFRKQTGIRIEIVPSGDAGELVNKAVLTKGRPLGDVLFGVDNTFLSRALAEGIFEAYRSPELANVEAALRSEADGEVTPIDHGEVCVNYDLRRFSEDSPPPSSLSDLTSREYRDQFVVQNPATSSPGLAFLLTTIERFGEPGWEDFWRDLRANGVEITSGWEEAYNGSFSGGGGGGTRPLVVSYASSPPAAVVFSEDPEAPAITAAMEDGCFRQIEFAGVLKGTAHPQEARKVIDFLLSEEFQADMPLNMFVFPVRSGVELPPVFAEHAARPQEVIEMDPARIEQNRERWLRRWTELMTQ